MPSGVLPRRFFSRLRFVAQRRIRTEIAMFESGARVMNDTESAMAREIAEVAIAYQRERTGHAPASVAVVMSEETLVITLHDALTPAEKALAFQTAGAAQVQDFHRQLFLSSADSLRKEITRITGRDVREAAAEIEPATGAIVHAFTTGTLVQVFQLNGRTIAGPFAVNAPAPLQ